MVSFLNNSKYTRVTEISAAILRLVDINAIIYCLDI